ncbi:50S ribosomal protein L15e [Candidatus Pacearchaeota archaeon CG_4_9_14_3_um_filter_31_7]|nr:MAG: 50S ribosomal protein L15e [Candidatus Pacearchaeota archaeon CG1_02_31_27]PIN92350.1 MAG: 50S ribosomal protein L15e [Candidatus Pacearchaeota archaeon CG10_big_fil_rev_8_21_14_0_10_31_59]PIZ80757.1 MAG: 50S ribosomal protein L15e [Candidatus Pacearchaeota archaeon CG_4_10_14_0_2_um_filter_31_10]PJA70529.1 MAG: 50S ribosomal protein L15e [Candidatus Pacearchaeota archaeon CG_4_9_14_3_um_filter_31_7]
MVKGLYHYLRKSWKKPFDSNKELMRERFIAWRKEPVVLRLEKPTRLDRARSLGYKAKKGFVVVRVRLKRGGHRRAKPKGGRQIKNLTTRKNLNLNYRAIAEIRAAKKYPNLEVLNSYWVGQDGKSYWFEVILVNFSSPEIKNDKTISWISSNKNRNRAFRGLTSANRKSRSLRNRGNKRSK